MATRDDLYARFGITAEAAQLFETELETLFLCLQAQREGWHEIPDGAAARAFLDQIDRKTLGRLLADVKLHIRLGPAFESKSRPGNPLNGS